MDAVKKLLDQNKIWASERSRLDPEFFKRLSELQTPTYLWIGCSDSRITPATSTGLLPGEMFVHRNVANLVVHTDMNCLSVIQFAVEVLKIEHIIVCGHYDCGGVKAALSGDGYGLIDNWLRHIHDIVAEHPIAVSAAKDEKERLDLVCELNVVEQVLNVAETTIVQSAWRRNQVLDIHGWIYRVTDGIFHDMNVSISSFRQYSDLNSRVGEKRNATRTAS
jgi:carbonic anhydrase